MAAQKADLPHERYDSKTRDEAPVDFRKFGESQTSAIIVIPTYNEALNIASLIADILSIGKRFDVLVVDDNSPDGTGSIVARIAEQTSRVHLLRRAGKFGLGTAYLAGFQRALQQDYAFIFEMDADFSHQPHYLPILLAIAEHDADVAVGSRNIPGGGAENWPWVRHLISKGGSIYARLVLGVPIHDFTGGFNCFRASALRKIDLFSIASSGYGFQVELKYRCLQEGLRIVEFPIVFRERVAGVSKMSSEIVTEAALLVLKLKFEHKTVSPERQLSQL